jgi:O-antigen/teichoic acid export membrane protein
LTVSYGNRTFSHLKKLASESVIYGLSGVLSKFLYVVLVPIYTRIFSPEDYGVLSLITNMMSLVAIFVVLGLDSAVGRWYYDSDDVSMRRTTIATWSTCQIAISAVAAISIVALSEEIGRVLIGRADAAVYVRISAMTLPIATFGAVLTNWLRLERKPWSTILFSLGSNGLSVLLTIYFAAILNWKLQGVFVAQLISAFCSMVVAAMLLKGWINPRLFELSKLKGMLKYSLPLIPAGLSFWIVNLSGSFFIRWASSATAEVGLYQVGSTVASAMGLFTAAFQQAWGPFALSIHKKEGVERVYADVLIAYLLLACFFALLLSLFAPEILYLVTTKAYHGAGRVTGLLSFNYVLVGLTYIAVIGATIARTTKPYGFAVVCASVLTILLNVIFVPSMGKEGAALATLIAQLMVPVYVFYQSQKLFPIPFKFVAAIQIFVIAFVLAFAGAFITTEVAVTQIILKICLGVIFWVLVLMLGIISKEKIKELFSEIRGI